MRSLHGWMLIQQKKKNRNRVNVHGKGPMEYIPEGLSPGLENEVKC